MSAVVQETTDSAVCVCGSDHLCGCGCGHSLNPHLRRAHELVASGATHGQAAGVLGVSRKYVSLMFRKPPKYLKGHYRLSQTQYETMKQSNAKKREARQQAHEQAIVRYCFQKIAAGDIRWIWRTKGGCASVFRQHQPAAFEDTLAEAWKVRRRREGERRIRDYIYHPISLDAPMRFAKPGEPVDFYDVARTQALNIITDDPAHVVLRDEAALTLRQIVGDMSPEDVQRMTAWDLDRLRTRLAAAGLMPEGVTEAEQERLREPNRHSGGSVAKAHGHSKKVRGTVKTKHGRNAQERHTRAMTRSQKKEHAAFRRERAVNTGGSASSESSS